MTVRSADLTASRSGRARPARVAFGALVALGVAMLGCRGEVQLGAPDASAGDAAPDASPPPVCSAREGRAAVARIDAAAGELRALAVQADIAFGAFVRPNGVAMLATASIGAGGGGAFVDVAQLGEGPAAIAVDRRDVLVASSGSGEVQWVHGSKVDVIANQPNVSSIVVGGGVAYWTLPFADQILAWDFESAQPKAIAVFPRAASLAIGDGGAVYVAGTHALGVLGAADAAPRRIADRCGPGAFALVGGAALCVDGDALVRVDLQTGAVVPLAGGLYGAKDVVAARGQVFYRTLTRSRALVTAMPLDGIGGPRVLEIVDPAPSVLATDGCSLYYATGGNLVRRAL